MRVGTGSSLAVHAVSRGCPWVTTTTGSRGGRTRCHVRPAGGERRMRGACWLQVDVIWKAGGGMEILSKGALFLADAIIFG